MADVVVMLLCLTYTNLQRNLVTLENHIISICIRIYKFIDTHAGTSANICVSMRIASDV